MKTSDWSFIIFTIALMVVLFVLMPVLVIGWGLYVLAGGDFWPPPWWGTAWGDWLARGFLGLGLVWLGWAVLRGDLWR